MDVRAILQRAWQMTQENLKQLIWYAFIPAFFTVVVSSGYLAYQYTAFKNSALFSTEESPDFFQTFKYLWNLASDYTGLAVVLLILGIVFFFGNILLKPMFNGALIAALQRVKDGQVIQGSVESGVRKFFPLFEFGLLMGGFKITTLFSGSSFILRKLGQDLFFFTLPIFAFVALAGMVINFFFTYTEYYIVLRDKRVIKAIMESVVLVFSNLRKTILVFMLMVLIAARIILNVLLILLIPMLVVFLATYFASFLASIIGIIFIGVFSLFILVISAYLLGLFQIVTTAVWVLTFDELTNPPANEPVPAVSEPHVQQGTLGHPAAHSSVNEAPPGPIQPEENHSDDQDSHLPPAAGIGLH